MLVATFRSVSRGYEMLSFSYALCTFVELMVNVNKIWFIVLFGGILFTISAAKPSHGSRTCKRDTFVSFG